MRTLVQPGFDDGCVCQTHLVDAYFLNCDQQINEANVK
jgi:hypothetical protein